MFEGLKDTLGRFREDVEDEIDEEAADDEAAVPEDATDEASEETAESEEQEGAEDEGETEETEETGEGDETDSVETEVEDESETADAEDADTEEAEEEGEPSDDEEGSAGFAQRARAAARGRVVIDEDDLDGALRDLEMALLGNDVEMGVAETILDRVRDELVGETRRLTTGNRSVVEEALHEALLSVVSVGQFDFEERIQEADRPVVIIFTGVNGVGKTTTIAKLSRYLEEAGYSSVMANGDTYRAGANEQLQEHANRLDRKLITHEQGGDSAAVIYDAVEYAEANDIDVVLGDTAGRLHTNEDLMNQLEKIDRVVDPDVTLFVDEAVAGQDAVRRAEQFNDAATIDGAILTKADADASGGAAISVAHVTGKPILFLGVGQGYDDLEPFDPEELVDRLLEE